MRNPKHLWVIRTKEKRTDIWGDPTYHYLRDRVAPKNRHFLSSFHARRKYFYTKDEAWQHFYKKVRYNIDMSACIVTRKKVFFDKEGYLDYWRNR